MANSKLSWLPPQMWWLPSKSNWPMYELHWLCVLAWLGLALLILSGCASGMPPSMGDVSCAELAAIDAMHSPDLNLADLYRRHCTKLPAPALLENVASLR